MDTNFRPRTDVKVKTKLPALLVRVCVYEIDGGEDAPPCREHVVNLTNPEKHKWFINVVRWAAQNGKFVELEAATPDDPTADTRRNGRR